MKSIKIIKLKNKVAHQFNSIFEPNKLELGGGANNIRFGWHNLDMVNKPLEFKFTKNCVFPVKNNSINIIYSSHTFEHLDHKTIIRVLSECKRILFESGKVIISIPDFDLINIKYKNKDLDFFKDNYYSTEALALLKKDNKILDLDGYYYALHHYQHLSYWTNKQFIKLFENNKFKLVCNDEDKIIKRYKAITPNIEVKKAGSSYFEFVKIKEGI